MASAKLFLIVDAIKFPALFALPPPAPAAASRQKSESWIRATADTINPASAIPKPVKAPRLFFTFVTAMIPRIKPKIAVKPQENIPNIPKTSEVTAIPLNFEVLADSLLARVGGTALFNTS